MIKIVAVSYNNQAPMTPLSAIFGRDGGTLGRSNDNFFVIPDPKNLVSRIQASIKSNGKQHTITNLSQASPILLNGKEITFKRECTFEPGDELQIGLYVLRAELPVDTASPEPQAELVPGSILPPQPPESPKRTAIEPSDMDVVANNQSAETLSPIAHAKPQPEQPSEEISASTENEVSSNDVLLQAFLKGAGIQHISLATTITPELMETLGKLFAASVKGTFQLLATRASIKREVKANQTVVVARNNNPLKFLPDSETVLAQMLRRKMPGFMGPAEAMQDAFTDLQAHQNGMIAGMNGAISEVLKRFDPKILENQTPAPTMFDTVLPQRRKAIMWDQYSVMYDAINKEAQRDYQKLFGKAFLKAYEEEIARSNSEDTNAK